MWHSGSLFILSMGPVSAFWKYLEKAMTKTVDRVLTEPFKPFRNLPKINGYEYRIGNEYPVDLRMKREE